MPMTADESRETVAIMLNYLSPRESRALALALWHRVGEKTENSSVRETLEAILKISSAQDLPPLPFRVYAGWLVVFVTHWAIALGNLSAAVWLVVCTVSPLAVPDWAIALPVVTFVVWTITSRTYDCPLSVFEDRYRSYFGLPPLKAFLSHYLVRPLRRAFTPESGQPKSSILAEKSSLQ